MSTKRGRYNNEGFHEGKPVPALKTSSQNKVGVAAFGAGQSGGQATQGKGKKAPAGPNLGGRSGLKGFNSKVGA